MLKGLRQLVCSVGGAASLQPGWLRQQQQQQRFFAAAAARCHKAPVHDLGGLLELNELKLEGVGGVGGADDAPPQLWELRTHAILGLLVGKKHITVDELRRGIEGLAPEQYHERSYYEKWAASMSLAMMERGVITSAKLEAELATENGDAEAHNTVLFSAGDAVRVSPEDEDVAGIEASLTLTVTMIATDVVALKENAALFTAQ
eukprot:gene1659-30864_t